MRHAGRDPGAECRSQERSEGGDAALAAGWVLGGGDHPAEGASEVVTECLLVGDAQGGERRPAEWVLVAAPGQEVNGGHVEGGAGLDLPGGDEHGPVVEGGLADPGAGDG